MSFPARPLALAIVFAFAGVAHAADQKDAVELKRVEVSESTLRMPQSQGALPTTITVITAEDLRQQLAINPYLSDAIGNLLPSFAPSTQKLSSRGQTLRGRNPLYMIEVSNQGLITFPGGVPIRTQSDVIIGAIGVSGSTVENDDVVARAGAGAVK